MGVSIFAFLVLLAILAVIFRADKLKQVKSSVAAKRHTLKGNVSFLALGIEDVRKKVAAADEEQKALVGDYFTKADAIFNRISATDIDQLKTEDDVDAVSALVDEAVVNLNRARKALGEFDEEQNKPTE